MTGRDEMPASVVLKARRPLWRSPRLGVGVLLIAGSVALGTWAIERAEHGQPVLVARHDLAPGDVVAAEDVTEVEMRWAGDHSIYVIGSDPAIGAVVTSLPKISSRPESVWTRPAIVRSAVVFPTELGPKSTKKRPSATSKERLWSARTFP